MLACMIYFFQNHPLPPQKSNGPPPRITDTNGMAIHDQKIQRELDDMELSCMVHVGLLHVIGNSYQLLVISLRESQSLSTLDN